MSDKATLKSFFETNDFPTAVQFADFIDSYGNFIDDESPQLAIVTLSSAQILALFTTPITIVPAQGANTTVKILSIVAKNIFDTTAYTVPAFSKLEYHEVNLAGTLVSEQAGGFVPSVASVVEQGDNIFAAITLLEDVDLVAAYTLGNPTLGDGTIEIHTLFSVQQF